MNIIDKAKYIWNTFVPKQGQADTVQGELLRAIEKLRWEAQENKNLNWDKDFEYFINFLKRYLLEEKSFTELNKKQISNDLDRISDFNFPVMDDDIYDRIVERIVDWYDAHPGFNSYENNINLNR
jgi:hypothetical protein